MPFKTKLTKASRISPSLRTTVPLTIAKHFNLRAGDELEWHLFESEDQKEMAVLIIPIVSTWSDIEKFTFKRVKEPPKAPIGIEATDEDKMEVIEENDPDYEEFKKLLEKREKKK